MAGAADSAARLNALRVLDEGAWFDEVRAALESSGSVPGAARSLGVGERTLYRWLRESPKLREGLRLRRRADSSQPG